MYKVTHTPFGKPESLIGSNLWTLDIAKEVARLSLVEWSMAHMNLADENRPREDYRPFAESLVNLNWKQENDVTWTAVGDDGGTTVTGLPVARIEKVK